MSEHLPVPTLICFDWGGVLLRICRVFEEGVQAAGLDVREGMIDPALYEIRRGVSKEFQVGAIDEAAFFQATSEAMGGLYTVDELALIHDAWLLGEYDGAAKLMDELNAKPGIQTGMLSNTNARHWERNKVDFPTASRANFPCASQDLRFAKPDAEIYAAFAKVAGYTGRESEILFFDDLEENITAAKDAGWQGFQIDHTGDTVAQMRAELARLGVL